MCDYSLTMIQSRPAKVGDKLVTKNFGTGTRGFAEAGNPCDMAICVLPGTELAFASEIKKFGADLVHKTAIFRQINKELALTHHDCLEMPDGERVLLTNLVEGQEATVLQLPAAPKTEEEAKEQTRLEVVG